MPTKPVQTVLIRASQTNYTTGPAALIGTATKISRLAAQISEGYVVDAPLGTFTIDAQDVNFHDNLTDTWLKWVEDGSISADEDAHIVEADLNGLVSVALLSVTGASSGSTTSVTITDPGGSRIAVDIQGSAGASAVELNAGTDQIGLELIGAGTGNALDISHGGTGRGAYIETGSDSFPSLEVLQNNLEPSSHAIQATTSGAGAGIRAIADDAHALRGEVTGTGAPLRLVPRSGDPSGAHGSLVGGMWVDDSPAVHSLGVILNTAPLNVHATLRPFVWLRSYVGPDYTSPAVLASGATNSVSDTKSFPVGGKPQASQAVIVTIHVFAWGDGAATQGTKYGFVKLEDDTAPQTVIDRDVISYGTFGGYPYTFQTRYLIPSGGDRTFTLTLSNFNNREVNYSDLMVTIESDHQP